MEGEKCPFSDLPSPIITDILIRLPTKDIVRCPCVCKTWLKLLSDSESVKLHLLRSPTCLIINNLSSESPESFTFNLVDIQDEPNDQNLNYVAGSRMELPKSGSSMTIVGSINGLVCLNEFGYQLDILHIWNPTMRQTITIQSPDGVRVDPNIIRYGFGTSSGTGQCKVARIFQDLEILDPTLDGKRTVMSSCQVYTLGEASWRSIGEAPFQYNRPYHGFFLNGNVHWLIDDPNTSEFMSCLDLEKEEFQSFPSPPGLSKDNKATLNLYKGCLSVCDNTADFEIVIWVMKEYGVEKSWIKEVVIPKSPLFFGCHRYVDVVRVVKVFKDGVILLLLRDYMVSSYRPEDKTWTSFDGRDLIGTIKKRTCLFEELHPPIQAMDHISTILSLKNFGMEIVKILLE